MLGPSNLKSYTERGFSFPLYEIDHCIASSLDQDTTKWPCDPEAHWAEIIRKLDGSKPVLIGHSILYDLCFLQAMFIGELPGRLQTFAQLVHRLVPRLVDTKLLVSQVVLPDIMDQCLSDIYKDLDSQGYPFIGSVAGWCYSKHTRSRNSRAHNAGFDSTFSGICHVDILLTVSKGYMTATIFLKLAIRQMHLQQNSMELQGRKDTSQGNNWESQWLEDPEKGDQYLQSLHSPHSSPLPSFDCSFFEPVRNKLRMSSAGILDLEKKNRQPDPNTSQLKEPSPQTSTEKDNILIKLKGQMDKLQTLIGNRVSGEAVEGIQDLCETLGCLRDELGKGHRH